MRVKDGQPFVAMRRVVENLGLAWQAQIVKLRDQADRFSCHDMVTTGADGKSYSMLTMPVAGTAGRTSGPAERGLGGAANRWEKFSHQGGIRQPNLKSDRRNQTQRQSSNRPR